MGGKKSWCFLQLLLAVRPIKMLFPASLGSGSMPAVLRCSWRLWGHAVISVKCKAEAAVQDGRRDFPQRPVGARPKGGCHLITAFVCRLWVSCCHCNPIHHRKLAAAGCFLSWSVLSCFCSSGRTWLYIPFFPRPVWLFAHHSTKLGSRKHSGCVQG